jgi:hypothetical protein
VSLLAILLGLLLGLPACPTEDSTNCYWAAGYQGNGEGTSFISLLDVTVRVG